MATYIILNLCFIAATMLVMRLRPRFPSRIRIITLAVLLVLAAIFDTLIISFGIVAYDPHKLLGLSIGPAPIEDFFYPLLSVILIPTLWNLRGNTHDQ